VGQVFGSNIVLVHSHGMEEIPVINHETSGRFEVLFQVFGTVKSHSLVVSSYIPNETKKLLEFKIKVPQVALVLNGELLKGRGVMRGIHEVIRKRFREGTYTDRRDVICDFEPPSTSPWWITIDDITWTVLTKMQDWPYKEGTSMTDIDSCQLMDN
jgi:hypothetical protein